MFEKECSACHQPEGVGTPIGPGLKVIRDRGKEAFLLNLLDPDREVQLPYLVYV